MHRFPGDMTRANLLALAGTAAALVAWPAVGQQGQPPAAAETDAVKVLGKAEIDALLAEPAAVLFLDVRRADEIAAIGGFPAYLNVQASELDRFLGYIPRDRRIVPVSNHAGRAKRAAALLTRAGFTVAGVAGVEDYAAAGGTLTGRKLIAPAIPGVIAADTRIELVREGFNGTEGPIALDDGSLLFTENRADRIIRIAADGTVATFADRTGGANALALGATGALIAVETQPSAIAVLRPAAKVLAKDYRGKPFNRPNDLALARRGDIYFTDPGAASQAGQPAAATAVYRLDPRGRVTPIATDIARPNGVALSPDEKILYLADSAGPALFAFPVGADGSVGARRTFAPLKTPDGSTASGADGIAVDAEGRVYVATRAGVQVFAGDGAALGVIPLPNAPQNLAFAGADRSKLYIVGRGSVYRIATTTRGVARPGK